MNTGHVISILQGKGTSAATTLLNLLLFTISPTLLEVIMVCGVLWASYGGIYSAITFCTIGGYVAFTLFITEWRTALRREMNDKDNVVNDKAVDSLLNFETVKTFTAEAHEINRYDGALTDYFNASIKSTRSLAVLNIGQAAIISVGLTLAMIFAGKKVADGEFAVGDLVAINAFIIQCYTPLSWLGTAYRMINQSFTDMEKMFDLMNEQAEVRDDPDAPDLRVTDGRVEFENVCFSYSSDKKILQEVSFVIEPGKMVAVVGGSGAGKSTLARLLLRFYDLDSGRILIDGQDIKHVTQRSLRQAIGVVPQDTCLFNDTIGYNIQFGRRDASPEEIETAAKRAKIHSFIENSGEGYETLVGERGLRLSGGEKQRVAIARTIMKNPHILILDEATSALDSKTERQIQESLYEVSQGRTSLVIAHRLSTIVGADLILVVKDGKIVERGTHHELVEMQGEYSSMWQQQQDSSSMLDFAQGSEGEGDEFVDIGITPHP